MGRILVSFLIIKSDEYWKYYGGKIIQSIVPIYEEYNLKINILGMRNLKSLGFFNVRRAFIKFDTNSCKPID